MNAQVHRRKRNNKPQNAKSKTTKTTGEPKHQISQTKWNHIKALQLLDGK